MSQKSSERSPNVSVTSKGKKLIQARLPFKSLASTPKGGADVLDTSESRKRKLSTIHDESRSIKLCKLSGAKENEVTVLETVDLVEDDIVMIDNGKHSTVDQINEEIKEPTKNVTEKETPLRRSNRKTESELPKKVLIKIPSAKKKKSNERVSKVSTVTKLDEDEDDDVIAIDSEENSIISVDGVEEKEKNSNENDDIILLDDNSSTSDNLESEVRKMADVDLTVKCDNVPKLVNSTTDVEHDEAQKEAQVSTDEAASLKKEEIIATTVTANDVVAESDVIKETMETSKADVAVDDEKEVPSSSNATEKDSDSEMDVDEQQPTESDKIVDDKPTDADSDQSKITTPISLKRSRKLVQSSSPAATPKTPTLKTSDNKSLTPKQLQKKLESEQKRLAKEKAKEERDRKIQEAKEERERKIQEAKEERERKLQEEREQKQKERDEKERQKKKERDDKEEQKRKEREDKEEQRRREKEEREKKKQAEIDAKNEEKRQKEEEKVAREEAEMKKKRKEAEAFTKFFARKSNRAAEPEKVDADNDEVKLNFMPFRVKPDMRLAPIVRRKLSSSSKQKFDDDVLHSTQEGSETDLYVQSLRNGRHVSQKQGKTWKQEDNSDDVMIIDDLEGAVPIEETSAIQKYRAKFFKFEENRRPPYYGTWQKKSSVIKPRNPFATDSKFFDYEIDSDDEWEDEEPGESLHGSDDEKDKESDDDYDIDNEFFVPHGHLSDEELANNGEIDDDNSPDTQKAKLKIMQKVFSDEMKKKTEKIKPRLVGLIWQNKDGSQPQLCPDVIWEMLQMRAMIFNGPTVVIPIVKTPEKGDTVDENNEAKKGSVVKKRIKLTDESVTDLIRLVHGNTNSSEFLSKEFRAFTAEKNGDNEKSQEFSLASIRQKIKELAEWKPCPEEGALLNKYCWYVSVEQRERNNMLSLPMKNDWSYILTPKTKLKNDTKKTKENDKSKKQSEPNDEPPASTKKPESKLGNIAKFTKVLSEDDKKKNFSIPIQESGEIASPKSKSDIEPSPKPAKKRVNLLMSVPRDQEIPVQTKNSLISQFLSSTKPKKETTVNDEPICID
ncbi:Chromatin assembly factor 1 subunit A [Pseudolycoriella hygida]|uniref:Chromatin assembly factor 1 subunit A n=1 Tax=Pseudolycoriella hygida TaxID=35572 RepID=A0A9Q0MNN7_9DIPT|nr:Chromatin assembly factor 1 subunit A [Pseudolycoriella hygida]